MIIDCHYHFDEKILNLEKLIEMMDKNNIDKIAIMAPLNDSPPPIPKAMTFVFQKLLTNNGLRNIGKKGLLSFFTKDNKIKITGGTITIFQEPHNESVFETANKYPERFLAWAFLNPMSEKNQIDELSKWLNNKCFVGVKAHPYFHRFEPEKLDPILNVLSKKRKPLLMHLGFDAFGDIAFILKNHPEQKIILAHAGFPYYGEMWKKIKEHKNVYVDLSQTIYINPKIIKEVVDYLGVSRCLYGSDGPYGSEDKKGKFDLGQLKNIIENTFRDEKSKRQLLGENFKSIIDS